MKTIAILFRILWAIILFIGAFFAIIANRDINQGHIIFLADVGILVFFEFLAYKLKRGGLKYKKTVLLILSLILLLIMTALFAGKEIVREYQSGGLF
ncbi:MAG: hypothetical protein DRP56_08885 [Planctomycetota bacterium]|nr:MAG: hypothetical protein DRP56_08885 [Planctomycetota bacterium]